MKICFSGNFYSKGRSSRSPGLHSYLGPSADLRSSHTPGSGALWFTTGLTTPYCLPCSPLPPATCCIHLSYLRGRPVLALSLQLLIHFNVGILSVREQETWSEQ